MVQAGRKTFFALVVNMLGRHTALQRMVWFALKSCAESSKQGVNGSAFKCEHMLQVAHALQPLDSHLTQLFRHVCAGTYTSSSGKLPPVLGVYHDIQLKACVAEQARQAAALVRQGHMRAHQVIA